MTGHTHLELLADVGDVSIVIHHLNEWKVVPLPTVIVVVVVSRGDLHSSRSKHHVYHLISHDGQFTITEWVETVLPYEVLGEEVQCKERVGGETGGKKMRGNRRGGR